MAWSPMLGGGIDPRVLERIKAMGLNGMGAPQSPAGDAGDPAKRSGPAASVGAADGWEPLPAGPDLEDSAADLSLGAADGWHGDPASLGAADGRGPHFGEELDPMKLAAALDAIGANEAQGNQTPPDGFSGGPAPFAPPPEAAAVEEYIKSQSMAAPGPVAVPAAPPPQMPPQMPAGGPVGAMASAPPPTMPMGPDGAAAGGVMAPGAPMPPGDLARMQAEQFRRQMMQRQGMGR